MFHSTGSSSGLRPRFHRSGGCLWRTLFVGGAIAVLFILLLLPGSRRSPAGARRVQCLNNLKMIGLAMHNYHDWYAAFPPAFTVDVNGNKLHSWRTLLLPYLDFSDVYASIDLTKPWDDPVNARARHSRPNIFACPAADIPESHTTYMALVGDDLVFGDSGPRPIREITGGTSHTIAVAEVPAEQAVHWMQPDDVAAEFLLTMQPSSSVAHSGGIQVLFADGFVRYLSLETAKETVRSLMSISESVSGEF